MRKSLLPILAILALGACQTSGSIDAGPRSSHAVLIVAEDIDTGSASLNNRINRRVLNGVATQFKTHGFAVFDENALSHNQGRLEEGRRGDREIIDLARSAERPPIDTIMLFNVLTERRQRSHNKQLRVRVSGRLISVGSGQRLGNFEAVDSRIVEPHCDGPCYRERVGEVARLLAREVAEVLGRKLGIRISGVAKRRDIDTTARGITLSFDNFSVAEMLNIEETLRSFSGYRSHRPIGSSHRYAELWYETSISHGELHRNLDRMLVEMGMQAHIAYRGDTYRVARARIPERARTGAPEYRW